MSCSALDDTYEDDDEKAGALEEYEDAISRLSIEAMLLRKAAGPHIASFLGLLRLESELVLATYVTYNSLMLTHNRNYYSHGSLTDLVMTHAKKQQRCDSRFVRSLVQRRFLQLSAGYTGWGF